MRITIDKTQKDALKKACIHLDLEVQFHELADDEFQLAAYVTAVSGGETFGITATSAFWLGCTFEAEKTIMQISN